MDNSQIIFFTALAGKEGQALCPNLEEIRGELARNGNKIAEELVRFAKMRHSVGHPIRKFVNQVSRLDEDVLEALRSFVDAVVEENVSGSSEDDSDYDAESESD